MDAYPLAQVQLGMVVEMLADDGRNHYHNSTCFRILDERPLDPDVLQRAVDTVLARHEILRSSFAVEGYSVPLQLVHPAADVTSPVAARDLTGLDADAVEASLRAYMAQERTQLFDLTRARDPLHRARLRRRLLVAHPDRMPCRPRGMEPPLPPDGTRHHLPRAARRRAPPGPDTPDIRYADFVAAELESLAADEDRAYWKGILDGHTPFEIPSGLGDDPTTTPAVSTAPGSPTTTWRQACAPSPPRPGCRSRACCTPRTSR
ncbi:condensation domain-containing protein [Streptomyces thinghirensis]|nr:condensation domain-containing protein [Streptomyces thinghirensis]